MDKGKQEELTRLVEKYRPLGVVTGGGELLLPPGVALQYITDLESLGIIILGGDEWQYVKGHAGDTRWLYEFPGAGWDTPDPLTNDAVHASADTAREYLTNHLLEGTAFILFTEDVPTEWSLEIKRMLRNARSRQEHDV